MISSHVKKVEVTEKKMCTWACGHTLRDHVRNGIIWEILKVENTTERCRKARLRWFGHVKRRDQEYKKKKKVRIANGVATRRIAELIVKYDTLLEIVMKRKRRWFRHVA